MILIGEPHLHAEERAVFDAALRRSRTYLEWGTGGSTVVAARSGVERMVCVESDRRWADAVRAHMEVARHVEAGSASVIHAAIGPVEPLGYPAGYGIGFHQNVASWPDYIRCAWAELGRRGWGPDLVFVDGRFRVACCLSVLLACPAGDSGPSVLLHDVAPDRPHYDEVFRFFDVVEAAVTIRLMRAKPRLDGAELLSAFLRHVFDPR